MIIFLSHNMSGISDTEVINIREQAIKYLKNKYPNESINFIENYYHPNSPEEFLQKEIEQLGEISYFYHDPSLLIFSPGSDVNMPLQTSNFDREYSLKLWHLGRSIQQLGQADAIYFIPGYSDSRGCKVEKLIAKLYGVEILNPKVIEDKLEKKYNIAIKALQAIAQRDNDYSSTPFLDCRKCAKNALKKLGESYSMNNKLNKEDK